MRMGMCRYHQMTGSVDVLNEHFAPANVQFKLTRADRYGNERWYTDVGVNNEYVPFFLVFERVVLTLQS